MAGNIVGITNYTGLAVGGGSSRAAAANGSTPASTVSGGVYPSATPQYAQNYSIITVVATTAVATKSTSTTAQLSGATIGDFVDICAGTSGLSAGLIAQAWVSAPDEVTIAYSNVSTANAAQIATAFRVQLIKVVA